MMRNSTIRQKEGICPLCSDNKKKPLTKGLCSSYHYWLSIRLKSAEKMAEREEASEPDLEDLKKEADAVFSRYLRLSQADSEGMVNCYICNSRLRWQDAQAMHYVKRANMLLRYDPRNVRVGDKNCNEYKGGNYIEYSKKLNEEHPGLSDYLQEEGHLTYKYSPSELKQVIFEYSQKLKLLTK